MEKSLKLNLPSHWHNVTELYANATFTFRSATSGLLQVMIAEYKGGSPPRPSESDLINFAVSAGNENHGGRLVTTFSGASVMGVFGSAVFKADQKGIPAYYQVWFLTNGFDLVFVIFESNSPPSDDELNEAQNIIEQLNFR